MYYSYDYLNSLYDASTCRFAPIHVLSSFLLFTGHFERSFLAAQHVQLLSEFRPPYFFVTNFSRHSMLSSHSMRGGRPQVFSLFLFIHCVQFGSWRISCRAPVAWQNSSRCNSVCRPWMRAMCAYLAVHTAVHQVFCKRDAASVQLAATAVGSNAPHTTVNVTRQISSA